MNHQVFFIFLAPDYGTLTTSIVQVHNFQTHLDHYLTKLKIFDKHGHLYVVSCNLQMLYLFQIAHNYLFSGG